MADYYYLEQGALEPFGENNGGGVATPKTASEMKTEEFAELVGEDFVYDSGLNDGYPVLSWEVEQGKKIVDVNGIWALLLAQ